ncbi:MAG: phosphoadenylyl-sulfate reductase [Nitrospirota bacterium]|jgi:phosphoadenosine phosphosulfate reductase|nr:phosphoadenylyl-sulfate reductase [Nitrospirota bacterium]MDH4360771.1 phosphoadenylyl-sulfate reductase [Nitrospirota bacterium]MDH5295787.1 phosphoadenylyl-sulfate reductase [Nitrospirota bacterium]MDH5575457.1 phosphoadenylyl-sulfate reductase [Nitrospirota bacterium]
MSLFTDTKPSPEELSALNQSLESQAPQKIVETAIKQYGPSVILACSFGAEDVVLVDMMLRANPHSALFYLDTDFLFPETHVVKDRIIQRYQLQDEQIIQVKSKLSPAEQATQFGEALWLRDPDQCCSLRKVEPLTRILAKYAAWITGIRRDQAPTRASAGIVEWDTKFGLVKFNPLATWSWEQVWDYIRANNVPYNELHDQHFPSIGCTHCTTPVMPGDDPRSGRWKSSTKTECGLHRS